MFLYPIWGIIYIFCIQGASVQTKTTPVIFIINCTCFLTLATRPDHVNNVQYIICEITVYTNFNFKINLNLS